MDDSSRERPRASSADAEPVATTPAVIFKPLFEQLTSFSAAVRKQAITAVRDIAKTKKTLGKLAELNATQTIPKSLRITVSLELSCPNGLEETATQTTNAALAAKSECERTMLRLICEFRQKELTSAQQSLDEWPNTLRARFQEYTDTYKRYLPKPSSQRASSAPSKAWVVLSIRFLRSKPTRFSRLSFKRRTNFSTTTLPG